MRVLLLLLLTSVIPFAVEAQGRPEPGPVIRSAGAVFEIEDPEFATPSDREYKLAFEMADASASPERLNVVLNSVARYLNMHAQAGVPRDRIDAAVVVHGTAGWEMLDHEAYRARHGVDNPNVELIKELVDAGVDVILCGQTASARGIPVDGLVDEVQVALSAMTAFLVLQDDGFKVNPW